MTGILTPAARGEVGDPPVVVDLDAVGPQPAHLLAACPPDSTILRWPIEFAP